MWWVHFVGWDKTFGEYTGLENENGGARVIWIEKTVEGIGELEE